jgi:nucleotide-binding universal stress UspA family protein
MTLPLAASESADRAPARIKGPIVASVGADDADVLQAAATLAPLVKEQVHVFSVVEPLPVEIVGGEPILVPPDLGDGRTELRIEQLNADLAAVRAAEHRWQLEVVHGEPVSMLMRRARELDAGLVVVGIGRPRPVDRLLGSETTLDVVRYASCPVLAVVGRFEKRPREVVIATDFSAQSMRAARCALPLLARSATLHIVHVAEADAGDPPMLAVEKLYARSITARLVRFVADLRTPQDMSVRMAVREGRCATQLLAYAREHGADLLVAGRHGKNPLGNFKVGSVTESLLRGASCSVLVAPERYAEPAISS